MSLYEYKVVPAPNKGLKAKGVKTPEGRFANSVQHVLNEQGADGWEYLRSELLPSDERTGLTSSTTNWRNVLVFRRTIAERAPGLSLSASVANKEPQMASGAERMLKDDGVEEISPVSGMTTALLSRVKQQADQSNDDADSPEEDEDKKD